MRRREVPGGAGSEVGAGKGAPRCGGLEGWGIPRGVRAGCGVVGVGVRRGGGGGRTDPATRRCGGGAGRRRRGRRVEGAARRRALSRGAELVGPGGPSGLRRRGRWGAGDARRPPLPPELELSGLGGGCSRWEGGAGGGRGWLHRGSHSASSSLRRRRHCVLSAPVARCGASGGGRSPRWRAEDPVLACSPGPA